MQRTNVLAVVVGWLLVAGGCGGPAVVPTSYDSFADKHNTYKIQAPGGWTFDSGGDGKKYSWAVFASGGATISIEVDGLRADPPNRRDGNQPGEDRFWGPGHYVGRGQGPLA